MPALSTHRMRPPGWRWLAVGAVVVAAFVLGLVSASGSSSVSTGSLSKPAPAWSGTTLSGSTLSSSDERGRWVVLNFFATWCGPCQAETPQLVRFATSNPASSVQLVGVIYDDPIAAVRSFAQSHHVTWPLLSDTDERISSAYGVSALPQSFVIRPNGTIAAHLYGGVTAAMLDKVVGGHQS